MLAQMTPKLRVAVILYLLAAIALYLSTATLHRWASGLDMAADLLALAGLILSAPPILKNRQLLNKRLSEIYADARQGKLSTTGMQKVCELLGVALSVVSTIVIIKS